MLGGDRMSSEFAKHPSVRYLEAPDPERYEWHATSGEYKPITFNLYMESPLSIVYDKFRDYSFLPSIGATPLAILSYCTYRFWSEEMQAAMGHIHDDFWCVIEEDIGNLLDSGCGIFTSQDQDKAQAYLAAVAGLVNEVYPFFCPMLHNFMQMNNLYGVEDMDLDVSGLMGYVVNFTLLKPA